MMQHVTIHMCIVQCHMFLNFDAVIYVSSFIIDVISCSCIDSWLLIIAYLSWMLLRPHCAMSIIAMWIHYCALEHGAQCTQHQCTLVDICAHCIVEHVSLPILASARQYFWWLLLLWLSPIFSIKNSCCFQQVSFICFNLFADCIDDCAMWNLDFGHIVLVSCAMA